MEEEEYPPWWWEGAGNPDNRPTIEVDTKRPRRLPRPLLDADGRPVRRYVHRFGIQPRMVEVRRR